MTPLTPQERAAVERAVKDLRNEGTDGKQPVTNLLIGNGLAYHERTFVYGHLSGFRAGVEAAIVALQETSPGLGALDDAEDRIRSLLTQEPHDG